MYNPFSEKIDKNDDDRLLVKGALEGSSEDLERLILRHQAWIFNIAIRMVFNPHDAEDITQEILIKIITKLGSYDPGKSQFRTWLYRIAVNHILNMKKRKIEEKCDSLDVYFSYADTIPDNSSYSHPELKTLIEESRISCMIGMLICLSRKERIVFILGTIINATDKIGSEICEISKANFRKILSRSRKKLYNYLNEKCGFMDENNPCKCSNKMQSLVEMGYIKPGERIFTVMPGKNMKEVVEDKLEDFKNVYYDRFFHQFRSQPFYDSPDYVKLIRSVMQSAEFKDMLQLH